MSREGKLFRGMKWWNQRDRDGNLPKAIKESEKILDVNFYLDFIKGKDEEKMKEILMKLSFLNRQGKSDLPEYKKLLGEIK